MNKLLSLISICLALTLMSCANSLVDTESIDTDNTAQTEIGKKIKLYSQLGYLDSLQSHNFRSANSDLDINELDYFINDTDSYIDEISKTENADIKLAYMETIILGGKVENIYKAFELVSQETADLFLSKMSEANNINDKTELLNLEVSPNDDLLTDSRTVFSNDFEWDTIGWYTAMCGTTIAGMIASSVPLPWIQVPGYIAASIGAGCMLGQLISWATNENIRNIATNFYNEVKKAKALGKTSKTDELMNSDSGKRFMAVIAETTLTISICYVTPAGQMVISLIKSAWNTFISGVINIIADCLFYLFGMTVYFL